MKKELKDYLHLYLGCNVIISESYHNGIIALLVGINHTYGVVECVLESPEWYEYHTYKSFNDFQVKPILRPLSDITGDELIQYGKIEFPDMKGRFDLKGLREVVMHAYYEPETFKWLLSKNFDLFGLIEAGLAIDKTTLK